MSLNITLRKTLQAKVPASGAWLTLPRYVLYCMPTLSALIITNSTAIARSIALTQGVSWVLIDAGKCSISLLLAAH